MSSIVICSKCKISKTRDDFYADHRHKNGLQSLCKDCFKANTRAYAIKNREKANAWRRRYCKSDKGRAARKRWSSSNRSAEKASRDLWMSRNSNYYYNNHEASLARSAVYRAVKGGVLTRPSECGCCGKECKPQAHHHSYKEKFRLDVEWLCASCHNNFHKSLDQGVNFVKN